MKRLLLLLAVLSGPLAAKEYTLDSPDGKVSMTLSSGRSLCWSVSREGITLTGPSEIALTLADGTVYGGDVRFRKAERRSVSQEVEALYFKRSRVRDAFNELTLTARDFRLVFRAYDDGVAYRFIPFRPVTVASEKAEFRFCGDWRAWIPYVRTEGSFEEQFFNSFENTYVHIPLSEMDPARLAFLPVTVDGPGGVSICLTEADLLDYPGMYLHNANGDCCLEGVFPAVPREVEQGGHNLLQGIVRSREDYICRSAGPEPLPWRVMVIVDEARKLADNDLVWRLSKPAEGDFSWVRPGKVAWEWWNSLNLYGVDFRAGVNDETYRYYIDFAASHGIEYVILDEGWSVKYQADLMQVVPELDLPALAQYAASRGVRLILWAGYLAFDRDMEAVCRHYAEMGIAGWKIDFLDRDDQDMVAFCERAARTAARYRQVIDFHGVFKPAGLTRTWPNVLNFEAVDGMEQLKWAKKTFDMVTYDVTIPFTRLVAGPMDYTQGAMRNATRKNFKAVYSEGMSQGTRCRQLAEYVVFDAPLTMLCDSPSNYLREPECTALIASIPTVWDETVCLDGRIGEYIVTARRSGSTWYVAGMTDWSERDLTVALPFRAARATLWRDGVNADRAARDYACEQVSYDGSLTVHCAPGGGFVLIFNEE